MAILICLAKLTYAYRSHANDASRTEAEQRGKYVEQHYMIPNGKPKCKSCYQGPGECQNHCVKAAVTITDVAGKRSANCRATI